MKIPHVFYSTLILLASTCLASKFTNMSSNNKTETIEVSSKCFKEEYNIYDSSELASIADCAVISGNVHIKNFDIDTLYLGAIREIKGDLTVKNSSSLIRMEAPHLNLVGGTLELNTLNSLISLSFPRLETVQTLKWQVLPILTFVNLDAGIKSIESVIMSDTSLTGFGGFNVETLKILNINNNRFLERIESTVAEVTEDLLISANSNNIKVSLPNLVWVKQMTIKDTESIDLESLQIVEKNADFSHNKFDKLDLPNLKSTGHTLSIINNINLKDVNFDKLSEVGGGFMIIDNDSLKKFDFFPSLRSIGGAIEFHGDISSNHFDNLKIIKGSAIMKSSSQNFDCTDWMKNEVARVVRGGKVECGSGKSSTTEVLMVDEDGRSTQGRPGINDNNKNVTIKDKFTRFQSSSPTKLSTKLAILVATYALGMLVHTL